MTFCSNCGSLIWNRQSALTIEIPTIIFKWDYHFAQSKRLYFCDSKCRERMTFILEAKSYLMVNPNIRQATDIPPEK